MMDQLELARRLKAAREAHGLSQDQAATLLEISRSKLAQIETGRQGVGSVELVRFAHAYGRGPEDFLAERFSEEETIAALFRSEAAATDEGRVLPVLRDCLALAREFTSVEQLMGVARRGNLAPTYTLPAPRNRYEAIQQAERVAEEERKRLGLGTSPVPDLLDLLECQGIRTGLVALPDDVDGLTISGDKVGVFVVVNASTGRSTLRQRFSFAHEYAHVLMDLGRVGLVSRRSDRDELAEVRANAFAAAFLLPPDGVAQYLEGLGKGRPTRSRHDLFDGEGRLEVEGREEPGSQVIQFHEAVQLAHHFQASRLATIYRLHSLKHTTRAEMEALRQQDEQGLGPALEQALGLAPPTNPSATLNRRFLSLALEAHRRGHITRSKLDALAKMAHWPLQELTAYLAQLGLEDEAVPAELPAELLDTLQAF
jgi:Zn-dependent peptidase ImmA (M78 family)/transcriptional regulator with XRE-family HTH domain